MNDPQHRADTNSPETVPANAPRDYLLADKVYDLLKPVTTTYLPGLVTLWLALASIWHWSNSEAVALTLGAINVFLGLVLQGASKSYNSSAAKYDGLVQLLPGETEDTIGAAVRVERTAEEMLGKKQVLLYVDKQV